MHNCLDVFQIQCMEKIENYFIQCGCKFPCILTYIHKITYGEIQHKMIDIYTLVVAFLRM